MDDAAFTFPCSFIEVLNLHLSAHQHVRIYALFGSSWGSGDRKTLFTTRPRSSLRRPSAKPYLKYTLLKSLERFRPTSWKSTLLNFKPSLTKIFIAGVGVRPENQNRAAQRRGSSGQTPHPPAMKGFLSTLIWFDCFVVQLKRRSINPYAEKGLNKRVWNTIQTLSRVHFLLATPWQRAWSVERKPNHSQSRWFILRNLPHPRRYQHFFRNLRSSGGLVRAFEPRRDDVILTKYMFMERLISHCIIIQPRTGQASESPTSLRLGRIPRQISCNRSSFYQREYEHLAKEQHWRIDTQNW